MAIGYISSPRPFIIEGFTMGLAAVDGLAYTPDADLVLTVSTSTDEFIVYPTKRGDTGDEVSAIVQGCVTAKAGVGGVTAIGPVTAGTLGRIIDGTAGTDHIVGYAMHSAIEDATFTLVKIA